MHVSLLRNDNIMMSVNYKNLLLFFLLFPAFIYAQSPEPTETNALLNVAVSSMESKPRQGEIVILTGQKNKKTFSGITDAKGKFSILIPEGDTYDIKYKTFGGEMKYKQISISDEEGMFTYQLDIKYDPPQNLYA